MQQEKLERIETLMQQITAGPPPPSIPTISNGPHTTTGVTGDNAQVDSRVQIKEQNVTNNIILNVWGQEDTSHVCADQVREILEAGGGTQVVIGRILRLVYHKKPENRNAYLTNKKDTIALVYEENESGDQEWTSRDRGDILPPMIAKGVDLLFDNQFKVMETASPSTIEHMDAICKELVVECPGPTPSPKLIKKLSPAQRSVLIANRPNS